jgi:hypothetical protein
MSRVGRRRESKGGGGEETSREMELEGEEKLPQASNCRRNIFDLSFPCWDSPDIC